jgi:hypothetical protein
MGSARALTTVLVMALIGISGSATAADGISHWSATPSVLLSHQPEGYNPGMVYLSRSLGGTRPGFMLAVQYSRHRLLSSLELGTTTPMKVAQAGRLVRPSPSAHCSALSTTCSAITTHRDTLLSGLLGTRFPVGPGALELKLGPSLVLGTPRQGDYRVEDAAGRFAVTGGVDAVIPEHGITIVAGVRYSYFVRGEWADYSVGLGHHALRFSLGLRLGRSQTRGRR